MRSRAVQGRSLAAALTLAFVLPSLFGVGTATATPQLDATVETGSFTSSGLAVQDVGSIPAPPQLMWAVSTAWSDGRVDGLWLHGADAYSWADVNAHVAFVSGVSDICAIDAADHVYVSTHLSADYIPLGTIPLLGSNDPPLPAFILLRTTTAPFNYAAVQVTTAQDFGGSATLTADYWLQTQPGVGTFCTSNLPPTADANGPYLVAADGSTTFDGTDSTDPDGDALTHSWTVAAGTLDDPTAATPTFTAPAEPGVYEVGLVVNDGQTDSDPVATTVVVYDPTAGFVTGGGWFESPAGALAADPTLTGRASFGFVSRYHRGATVPDGNTAFVFTAGDLEFHATSYDWLVVNQGGSNAQFKGNGTINGVGDYRFMIWATDGSPDAFRISIWEQDASGDEHVVYDTGSGQVLAGGSIVVHTPKR